MSNIRLCFIVCDKLYDKNKLFFGNKIFKSISTPFKTVVNYLKYFLFINFLLNFLFSHIFLTNKWFEKYFEYIYEWIGRFRIWLMTDESILIISRCSRRLYSTWNSRWVWHKNHWIHRIVERIKCINNLMAKHS